MAKERDSLRQQLELQRTAAEEAQQQVGALLPGGGLRRLSTDRRQRTARSVTIQEPLPHHTPRRSLTPAGRAAARLTEAEGRH